MNEPMETLPEVMLKTRKPIKTRKPRSAPKFGKMLEGLDDLINQQVGEAI